MPLLAGAGAKFLQRRLQPLHLFAVGGKVVLPKEFLCVSGVLLAGAFLQEDLELGDSLQVLWAAGGSLHGD